MFNKKKDYIKKKYKDVEPLNIGDVNRTLYKYRDNSFKLNYLTQIENGNLETDTQLILKNNVMRLIEKYGDKEINYEALNKMYRYVDENEDIQYQIAKSEYSMIDLKQGSGGLQDIIDVKENYLNILQTIFAKNCLNHYQLYQQAQQLIDEINQQSSKQIENTMIARKKIQATRIINKKGYEMSQKINKIQNIKQIIEQLQTIKQKYTKPFQMYVESLSNQYIDAEQYINELKQLGDSQYSFWPQNILETRIEYIKQLTLQGLMNQMFDFKSHIYQMHLNSFNYLQVNLIINKKSGYIEQFEETFFGLLKKALNQKIIQILTKIEDDIDCPSQIGKENIMEFYRELCSELVNFAMNIHMIGRYHFDLGQTEFMFSARKTVIDDILLKLMELIDLADKWKTLKKEDLICFFGILCLFVTKCDKYMGQSQKKFKEFIESKFREFIQLKGNDKVVKDLVQNEDCKKCLKVTLNQTQNILNLAQKVKFRLFTYEDPFPDSINIFKSAEFRKVIELFQGAGQQTKKQAQTVYLFKGKERNIVLTYTVNQIYFMLQQYLLYIIFFPQESQKLQYELEYIVSYYMQTLTLNMLSEQQRKLIFEDAIQLSYDQKIDIDSYTHQFDIASETIIFRENYPGLSKFLKEIGKNYDEVQNKFDLNDKITYIESILFLVNEFELIQQQLPQFKAFYDKINTLSGFIQTLIIKATIPQDLMKDFLVAKYDIKQTDKEDPIRSITIDKIIQFTDLKLQGYSQQQLDEVQKIINEGIIQQVVETFSKVKKVNNLGRDAMLFDLQRISKQINIENQIYEGYLKIYNNISQDIIINYIFEYQKIFPFRMLLSLLSAPIFCNMKRQARKDTIYKIFQQYQAL